MVFDAGCFMDSDAYLDGPEEPSFEGLASVLFPTVPLDRLTDNQDNDVMHLLGHVGAQGDVFLTNNTKDFIDGHRRGALASQWGIVVQTPDEFVQEKQLAGWP